MWAVMKMTPEIILVVCGVRNLFSAILVMYVVTN